MWRTAKFVDSVEIPYIAPSLGGCESLIEQPTIVSYWDQVGGDTCMCMLAAAAAGLRHDPCRRGAKVGQRQFWQLTDY